MQTTQETFWQGEFGNDYTLRNSGADMVAANTAFFSKVLASTAKPIQSVLELGANRGQNLLALRHLLPSPAVSFSAVEINPSACETLNKAMPDVTLHQGSINSFEPTQTWDLVFTKGVLIHIAPDLLEKTYQLIDTCAKRYILIAEYYNPQPVSVDYRGHSNKLFKRDFAGELLTLFPELTLLDYGFLYHRDNTFPQDDITWFLLEKM
ncbi:MAG: pseudaminic acid biosynthesis-associated methylase [Cyanobacteria bacterium P01_H01_bin.74]